MNAALPFEELDRKSEARASQLKFAISHQLRAIGSELRLSPIEFMASIFLTYQIDKRRLTSLFTLSGGRECLPRGIRIARQHGWLLEFLLAVQGRPYFIRVSLFRWGCIFFQKVSSRAPSAHNEGGVLTLGFGLEPFVFAHLPFSLRAKR